MSLEIFILSNIVELVVFQTQALIIAGTGYAFARAWKRAERRQALMDAINLPDEVAAELRRKGRKAGRGGL